MCLKKILHEWKNSVDPDQMPHYVASDMGLHCLCRPMTPMGWLSLKPSTQRMLEFGWDASRPLSFVTAQIIKFVDRKTKEKKRKVSGLMRQFFFISANRLIIIITLSIETDRPEQKMTKIRPRGYKTFFMLNSAEHEISPANKSPITNNWKFSFAKYRWAWKFLC